MLRAVGFDRASILDGGFNQWQKKSLPTSKGNLTFSQSDFIFSPRKNIFVNKEVVLEAINNPNYKILNSLTADIHNGENPRYGRPGRIPSSINVPFHELLDSETGKFKKLDELSKIFQLNGINKDEHKRKVLDIFTLLNNKSNYVNQINYQKLHSSLTTSPNYLINIYKLLFLSINYLSI